MDELDHEKPNWDKDMRLLGVARRLERDFSPEGILAAIDVYGKDAVREALSRAGLRLESSFAKTDAREQNAEKEQPKASFRSVKNAADHSRLEREVEVLLGMQDLQSIEELAQQLSLNRAAVTRLRQAALNKVRSRPEKKAGTAKEVLHPFHR